jgi:uncharacterized protein (TIGR00725 family)
MKNQQSPIIGVMGPGNPDDAALLKHAEELGKRIAQKNWILLTGGRKAGVMDAASKGAFEAGGTIIGILPGDSKSGMSDYVTIPILTGMGNARNVINILTADVVVVCGMGPGTASEAALAMKCEKPLLFTMVDSKDVTFFNRLNHEIFSPINNLDELVARIETIVQAVDS